MRESCCVCHRKVTRFETVILTDEEKVNVEAMGVKPAPKELYYCKACWKVLGDRLQGAQLIKGMVEMSLRKSGIVNADKLAEKFQAGLLAKARRTMI